MIKTKGGCRGAKKKKLISSASEDFENFQVIGMSQLPTLKESVTKTSRRLGSREGRGVGGVSKAKNLWWEGGRNESFLE